MHSDTNTALLCPARFSQFEGVNSPLPQKVSDKKNNFRQSKIGGVAPNSPSQGNWGVKGELPLTLACRKILFRHLLAVLVSATPPGAKGCSNIGAGEFLETLLAVLLMNSTIWLSSCWLSRM